MYEFIEYSYRKCSIVVKWKYALKTFGVYPKAKKFKDWRAILEEMPDSIDAVMEATPDHNCAGIAAHAIR